MDLDGHPFHDFHNSSTNIGRNLIAPHLSRKIVSIIEALFVIGMHIDKICDDQYLHKLFGDLPTIRDNFIMRKDITNKSIRLQNIEL